MNNDINDALVDTYRALRAINQTTRATPIVPRSTACIPGKRLKNWHRASNALGELHRLPLRVYARLLAKIGDTAEDRAQQVVARAWLAGKGIRP